MSEEAATVYLVGAGPGDLGLVTRRAEQLIRSCDALVYDYLANPALLHWVKAGCETLCVGKRSGFHSKPQPEIEDVLVGLARSGKTVVRLKGGDPFVFGRGGEEVQRLHAAGVSYEVVPAVTAAIGAAAYLGFPLTHRDHAASVTFLTGHRDVSNDCLFVEAKRFAALGGTLCIYMGVQSLPRITRQLQEGGMPPETPAAAVQWATLGSQRSVRATLATIVEAVEAAGVASPAIITLGEVAGLDPAMNWFETRPLHGIRVATTRASRQNAELAESLTALGAEVLELPLIEVTEAPDTDATAEIFGTLQTYQWLVFTSANGVEHFFGKLRRRFRDLRALGGLRIACVGGATKRAVERFFLEVDFVPETSTGAALAEELLRAHDLEHYNVLVVTGNRNRPDLVEKLEGGLAIVDTVEVYQTGLRELADDPSSASFREQGADFITFTSTSTVESFAKQAGALALGEHARRPQAVSIGPQTTEKLKALNIPLAAEAKTSAVPALVEAVVDSVQRRRSSDE
ncbi:MAG: uroporphyrinogen-III C-methyltransferase [Opitutales bacterium]